MLVKSKKEIEHKEGSSRAATYGVHTNKKTFSSIVQIFTRCGGAGSLRWKIKSVG